MPVSAALIPDTGAALADAFAAAMAALEPFEPAPRIAAGVSGGADSMALALLAESWVRARGGTLLALVVDHGLRPESAAEAAVTVDRLAALGIPARLLTLSGLARGPALAERARAARYQALTDSCAAHAILHLLLGHHAADQAETVMIRVLGGSRSRGLAAMPALAETRSLRLLRPLLAIPPARLRALLRARGVAWVEDPSNADPRALRARLRARRADPDGEPAGTRALVAAASGAGEERRRHDHALAADLACSVSLRPEGFARLHGGPIMPESLAAVIQAVAGAPYAPPLDQVAGLAASPRPATLWGVRIVPAGRLGPGFLLAREEAAMAPPVPAVPGAAWDGRFRLSARAEPPDGAMLDGAMLDGAMLGALGADAAGFRRICDLPSVVLRTLPALRRGKTLAAVPHLSYPDGEVCVRARLLFSPTRPVAGAPFLPARLGN